ncbi:MAG: M28 family peptidase [Algicola sp.]|nr:M28 family peptidase [Algicola sp.]
MRKLILAAVCCLLPATQVLAAPNNAKDVDMLVAAMMQQTPIIDDLKQLTDTIGGRLTGSKANEKAVQWALDKFKQAGVKVQKEAFTMPRNWQEVNTSAKVYGKGIAFEPQVVSQPFTPDSSNMSGGIVDIKHGTAEDFAAQAVKGKWLLVQTMILDDVAGIGGLFQEYKDAPSIEKMALKQQARGVIYMSSRPKNLLYRRGPSVGPRNTLPIMQMQREHAKRVVRLLSAGHDLSFSPTVSVASSGEYTSHNIVAEITGSKYPDQYVVIGAHLDSFDLGTGALDNGSNSVIMIDLARQIKRLDLRPKRTMRFVLYNGEEQGMYGSWAYTKTHADELDKTVMTATMDIGTGRVNGVMTNGRNDYSDAIKQVLKPVAALGPFSEIDHPVVGTDNYDFMMQGVPNLILSQTDSNYASNYHAQSDTFDKVDQRQLKLNSAIAAALIYGFANIENVNWQRQSLKDLEAMINSTDLPMQMVSFGLWKSWADNQRGMKH